MDEDVKAARDAILAQITKQAPECGDTLIRDLAEAYALVVSVEPERVEEMAGQRPGRRR